MKIYTGITKDEVKLAKIKEMNLGIMISSCYDLSLPTKVFPTNYALDNGAFSCYTKGYPFQRDLFMSTINKCYKKNIILDFIVCPDIVCGGKKSLSFSASWAEKEMLGTPNLALVVQDGMETIDVLPCLSPFSYIFLGGSVEWKWKNAKKWVSFAKEHNKKVHIGQCGQLKYLNIAKELEVDSVDSTSFVRNGSWNILEKFYSNKELF